MSYLDEAVRYAAMGWCILPMNPNKSIALRTYKRFQNVRPTPAELEKSFKRRGIAGLGIMCGMVSGGVYCRDFDTPEAYEAWKAAYPALAAVLPTVQSARGCHVYARSSEQVKTVAFDDGELRGEMAFVALPPSRHPRGVDYCWIIHPGKIPLLSPSEAGLNRSMGVVTEKTEGTETTEETEKRNGHLSLRLSVSLSEAEAVEAAIVETLPTKTGLRNDNIFTFARALKAIPTLADAAALDLKAIVREWHERSLSVVSTKSFDVTWSDFCHAWKRVLYPIGQSRLDDIMESLLSKMPPPEAAEFETPEIKMLVALCAELQRQAGNQPFYLDCRSAGRCLKVDHNTANDWLNMFWEEQLMQLEEEQKPGRARRWRWLGRQTKKEKIILDNNQVSDKVEE